MVVCPGNKQMIYFSFLRSLDENSEDTIITNEVAYICLPKVEFITFRFLKLPFLILDCKHKPSRIVPYQVGNLSIASS